MAPVPFCSIYAIVAPAFETIFRNSFCALAVYRASMSRTYAIPRIFAKSEWPVKAMLSLAAKNMASVTLFVILSHLPSIMIPQIHENRMPARASSGGRSSIRDYNLKRCAVPRNQFMLRITRPRYVRILRISRWTRLCCLAWA